MDDLYRSLLELLKEESAVVGRLVEFGQDETTALQEDDISAIKSAISRQEEEIKRLSVLEERRAEVLASIDGQDGIERAGRMKDELEIEGSRLATRLQELAAVNETNRLLANQALSFAAVLQEALADVTGGYDEKGRRTDLPGFTTIDTSA
ncbi:MAG: flagellar protein FlgN [Syntrophaceticus sp.]|jgi:hypothetical protein